MSQSRPALNQTLQENVQNLRETPEKLSSKKRLLYEIEQILSMQEKDLGLEALNKTSGRVIVSNRTLYKIYKALLQEQNLQPSMVYTGNSILEKDTAEEIIEKNDKDWSDLELTI
jgi:hypothetical protein